MALKRTEIKMPVMRKQAVPVPALGGEVVVRAMMASERLGLSDEVRKGSDAQPAADAVGHDFKLVARILAHVVVDPDEKPLMTEREWEIFGGQHLKEMLEVFHVAQQLSGQDVEANLKN